MRNVSDKGCRENQSTHFMVNNFFSEKRVVYEIIRRNMVEPDMPQMANNKAHALCMVGK
jgi:hypothetical protein